MSDEDARSGVDAALNNSDGMTGSENLAALDAATGVTALTVDGITYSTPYVNLMPQPAADELAGLRADIVNRGIQVAVVVTDDHEVIDGHTRLQIAAELGLTDVPVTVVTGLDPDQKRALALSLNIHRRHLSRQQRRERIATCLKADPTAANTVIAIRTKTSDKTVATVREELEATSEIPKLDATRGADGRVRRAARVAEPAPVRAVPWSYLKAVAGNVNRLGRMLNDVARLRTDAREPSRVKELADELRSFVAQLDRFAEQAPAPLDKVAT